MEECLITNVMMETQIMEMVAQINVQLKMDGHVLEFHQLLLVFVFNGFQKILLFKLQELLTLLEKFINKWEWVIYQNVLEPLIVPNVMKF